MSEHTKPRIGISIGDLNGLGPELVIRTFADDRILNACTPVIYCNGKVLAKYKRLLNQDSFQFFNINNTDEARTDKVNVISCWNEDYEIEPGTPTKDSGKAAWQSLKAVANDLKEGKLDAMVTCPIDKHNIQADDFKFPGHTEYLAQHFESKDSIMLMTSDVIKIGVATGHIPLEKIKSTLNKDLIVKKIKAIHKSLIKDYAFAKPKIAVMSLNPHAGENGLLGTEENDFIIPAIEEAKEKGIIAFGPYGADGFFGAGEFSKFDAILAMYHDQGLIPFKTLTFDSGVNFTAGLSAIRTSPGHGTAYHLAGKGTASIASLVAAIYEAIHIYHNRQKNLQ